jgi:hypothetical protein
MQTAATLEREYEISRCRAYCVAKRGLIPLCKVGPKHKELRFVAAEVLEAQRCPVRVTH